MRQSFFFYILLQLVAVIKSARILGVFPAPSISHQVVFRKLVKELAKRGHEVVVLTPDPMPKELNIYNITQIDLHDISYNYFREHFTKTVTGVSHDPTKMMELFYRTQTEIFEMQMTSAIVQKFIKYKDQQFDLIVFETLSKPSLAFTQRFKAPAIQISSLHGLVEDYSVMGIPFHPLLTPNFLSVRLNKLTLWEKIREIYAIYKIMYIIHSNKELENKVVKRVFGEGYPRVEELSGNAVMMFVNVNPIFDFNRAVPPSVVFLGGMHMEPVKKLPNDLQRYLDSSNNGVIYLSFGTNIMPSIMPERVRNVFVNVLSKLPYNVIAKWDTADFDGVKNVKVGMWWPQNDLLRHPNIKLFINQAGLQSTDESVDAHVPMLALPTFGDQYFNAERYVQLGIGKKLLLETLTEAELKDAIEEIIGNKSYRENIVKLDRLVKDQPQTPMERAVWWTEYVLRHGGAKHLRSPLANVAWSDFIMLDVLSVLLLGLFSTIVVMVLIVKTLIQQIVFKVKLE